MEVPETRRREWPRPVRAAGSGPEPPGRDWYACYTRARHEKRVARMLRDRELDGYLPLVERERRWNDRMKRVAFPLFPGYVFVRIGSGQIYEVTTIPSVVTIVTVDGAPARIPEAEIDNIRRFARGLTEAHEQVEPEPMVRRGHQVVVTRGPFRDVRGIVVEERGSARVLVGLPTVGQGFAINVPMDHLRIVEAEAGLAESSR